MEYKEEKRDLFSVPDEYYLAHCISADFRMGSGIAVEFVESFDMRNKLQSCFNGYLKEFVNNNYRSDCLLIGRVFNLITKAR